VLRISSQRAVDDAFDPHLMASAAPELGDMNFAGGHVRQHVRAAVGFRERA
jgi:hypothetical protein